VEFFASNAAGLCFLDDLLCVSSFFLDSRKKDNFCFSFVLSFFFLLFIKEIK